MQHNGCIDGVVHSAQNPSAQNTACQRNAQSPQHDCLSTGQAQPCVVPSACQRHSRIARHSDVRLPVGQARPALRRNQPAARQRNHRAILPNDLRLSSGQAQPRVPTSTAACQRHRRIEPHHRRLRRPPRSNAVCQRTTVCLAMGQAQPRSPRGAYPASPPQRLHRSRRFRPSPQGDKNQKKTPHYCQHTRNYHRTTKNTHKCTLTPCCYHRRCFALLKHLHTHRYYQHRHAAHDTLHYTIDPQTDYDMH
jgi:hypothetical protein